MMRVLSVLFLFCSVLCAKINVSVSIIPQAFFVKQIAGDLVDVNVMVAKGKSPETYEPNMQQLEKLSRSSLYFNIGMPFEESWLARFKAVNPNMQIIPPLKENELKQYDKHEHHEHHDDANDEINDDEAHHHAPHIWLSFVLSKSHIKQIAEALIDIDPANKNTYEQNLNLFLTKIDEAYKTAKEKLADKNKIFIVYHPAWHYIADELGLIEYAIEVDGKEAKIAHIQQILSLIKKHNIKYIFVQPQFSQKSALAIAKETGVEIQIADPLAYEWLDNLNNFIDLLSK